MSVSLNQILLKYNTYIPGPGAFPALRIDGSGDSASTRSGRGCSSGFGRPRLAAYGIVALLGSIVATTLRVMLSVRRASRIAALLLLPDALSVRYATALDIGVLRLSA
ncbi:MAG: hypothetical protein HKN84_13750 [Gammaproteobacteria bacterium]|nr:hypothetical protein [Gammaproteobacteria bacterium]